MERVSIIIPCFNAGDALREAVDASLAQTYPDVEVVVVDDGSTDPRTLEVLREVEGERVRLFRQDNGGPSAARNRAIHEATGTYILPLDADDSIEPTYVAKAVDAIQEPGIGIVYCQATKFGAESGPWSLPEYTLRELVIDNVIFVTSLFRKDDWARVGGFNEGLRKGVEDYDFWIKLVNLGCRVHRIDEPLFHYRVQAVSRTSNFHLESSNVVETYAKIFRDNIDFFAKNAEMLFEHRFGLYAELDYWKRKYGYLERLSRHPLIAPIGRWANRVLVALMDWRSRRR